jgi:hypothetical protein
MLECNPAVGRVEVASKVAMEGIKAASRIVLASSASVGVIVWKSELFRRPVTASQISLQMATPMGFGELPNT